VCGEDLGMIPACVHPVMQELGLVGKPPPLACFPGCASQRMPAEENAQFGDPLTYPYMTVASPSRSAPPPASHPRHLHHPRLVRGGMPSGGSKFYEEEALGGEGKAPAKCTPPVLEHIIQQHMDSPSLLAIFPLQHYWRYRIHVTLEDIQQDADLRCLLVDMLQAAQRYHGPADTAPS
ncbi:hypothetical protein ABPG77_006256, partial [Micractinium sp. CCAP 211/92]